MKKWKLGGGLYAANQGVIKGAGKTVVEGEEGEGKCIDEGTARETTHM